MPWLARPLVRRARAVVCASTRSRGGARLGARNVRVIPSGVEIPHRVGAPDDPPHVLFVGRLCEEKGIEDFVDATEGLPSVIVGDGPLARARRRSASCRTPSSARTTSARPSSACRRGGRATASRPAGDGLRAPVVATRVGGLSTCVEDGVTGLLVDRSALRAAIERLLADPALRARLGAAARAHAIDQHSWEAATAALLEVYSAANVDPHGPAPDQAIPGGETA